MLKTAHARDNKYTKYYWDDRRFNGMSFDVIQAYRERDPEMIDDLLKFEKINPSDINEPVTDEIGFVIKVDALDQQLAPQDDKKSNMKTAAKRATKKSQAKK